MIYHASETFDIPNLDLLTFLFDSKDTHAEDHTPLHASAADPSICLTKSDIRTLTKQFAHSLRTNFSIDANGPGKDIVTVISSGHVFLPIVFYGIIAVGGVYSAASSAMSASELARQVKDGPSSLIICSADVKETAREAAKACGVGLEQVLVIGEEEEGFKVRALEGKGEYQGKAGKELGWEKVTENKVLEERPIVVLYSSGTTGVPKGVPLSNINIVSECYIPIVMSRRWQDSPEGKAEGEFEYRTLAHLPAAHIAGVLGYFINPFYNGGLVYWMPRFDFAKFLEYNKKYRITFFFTVPPIYLLIAKSPAVKDHFKTLRWAISGAAPLGKELQAAASAKLGGEKTFVSQTWGLSETTGSVTLIPYGDRDTTGSVSKLLPNTSLRIVDDSNDDVPAGQPGEILIKGPMVFRSYHNNPTATASSFHPGPGGWFKTGDIGLMTPDGLLHVVDRKKELIKYKGLQVAPAELEALLLSHSEIQDAAVIGVPFEDKEGLGTVDKGKDALGDEVPRAYVVANKKKVSEGIVKDWVKKNAAAYKQLRGGVVFVDAIPKSPAGKILRKDLRERARKERDQVRSRL